MKTSRLLAKAVIFLAICLTASSCVEKFNDAQDLAGTTWVCDLGWCGDGREGESSITFVTEKEFIQLVSEQIPSTKIERNYSIKGTYKFDSPDITLTSDDGEVYHGTYDRKNGHIAFRNGLDLYYKKK